MLRLGGGSSEDCHTPCTCAPHHRPVPRLASAGAGNLVHFQVFLPGPGEAAKMSNEPPPPYPGGPTAPLLEEKSGAPPTPGRALHSRWSGPLLIPATRHWCLEQPCHRQCSRGLLSFSPCSLSRPLVPSCDAAPFGHVTAPCRHWPPTL